MDILSFQRAAFDDGDDESGNPADVNQLDLLPVQGGWQPAMILPGPVLGKGRAAHATLVEAINASGESILAVEKTFCPGLLTRTVYRAAFQAPFAYQHTRDAILACYYRRRVAAAIVSATMMPGVRVAVPLYVRHDSESNAWVLGSEFIRGRGIRPAPANAKMFRNWAARKLLGRSIESRRRDELAELVQVMNALEWVFRKSGLVGAGWQVCPRALVSTANLLRTDDGYVLVDLESGMPAVAVGRYVFDGLRLGSPPLFDDIDVKRLSRWLDSRRLELTAHLGREGYELLCEDTHHLVYHTSRWKRSEFAFLRNRSAILGRSFRRRFNRRLVDTWLRSDLIDAKAAERMRSGGRVFRHITIALGLIPGRTGRFLQRCWAHRTYRSHVRRFLDDSAYRHRVVHDAIARRMANWRDSGRGSPKLRLSRINLTFIVHFLLSGVTPASVHRWLTDSNRRREVWSTIYLFCASQRFQSAYGRHLVGELIRGWQRQGRLQTAEANMLHKQLAATDLDEYVRCMGMHLGLKILLPALAPLKFGGLAATSATGNPLYLLPIFALPAARTAITLWRMLHPSRRHIRYFEALLIGPLPIIGSLAYPVQMRASHPELSEFLLREAASRIGRMIPVYGGKDSRMEIWAIRAVNVVLETMDLMRAATRPFERLFARRPVVAQYIDEPVSIPLNRQTRLEARRIAQLAAAESPEITAAEAAWFEWNERHSHTQAA